MILPASSATRSPGLAGSNAAEEDCEWLVPFTWSAENPEGMSPELTRQTVMADIQMPPGNHSIHWVCSFTRPFLYPTWYLAQFWWLRYCGACLSVVLFLIAV